MNNQELIVGNVREELEELEKLDIKEEIKDSAFTQGTLFFSIICC